MQNDIQEYLSNLKEESDREFDLTNTKDQADLYEVLSEAIKVVIYNSKSANVNLRIVPNGLSGLEISCSPK